MKASVEGRLSYAKAERAIEGFKKYYKEFKKMYGNLNRFKGYFQREINDEQILRYLNIVESGLRDAIEVMEADQEILFRKKSKQANLITEIIRDAVEATKSGKITVNNLLSEGMQVKVRGHRLNLISAVYDLLSNALKHGEAITVNFSLDGDSKNIKIKVIDDGPGVSSGFLDYNLVTGRLRIFDLNASTDEVGTGFGLADAWYISKGKIEVLFEQGKGTTFTIYFPIDSLIVPLETEVSRSL